MTTPSLKGKWAKPIKSAKNIFTSIYLIALYSLAVYLAVMTLAIHQIHQKTSKLQEDNGEEAHFWLLKKASDYHRDLPETVDKLPDEDKLKAQKRDLTLKRTVSEQASSDATNAFNQYVDTRLGIDGAIKYKEENIDTWLQPKVKRTFAAKYAADYQIDKNDLKKLYDDHLNKYKDFKSAKFELSKFNITYPELTEDKRIYKETKTKNYIREYIGTTASDEKIDRIFMLAMEFGALEDRFICFGASSPQSGTTMDNAVSTNQAALTQQQSQNICLFKSMATTRTEFLTLILVLTMGGVGGLIHLTQDYLTNNRRATAAYYVFRPALGILAAFATFILVKAGVLAVAGSAQTNGEHAPLSPFFVSFLGIISGLLAQSAIQNVQEAAKNVFRSSNLKIRARWARADASMNVKILADNADPSTRERLRNTLDETDGILDDWLTGRSPTPIHAQQAIAIWLNKDIHDLFHDTQTYQEA